jgi:hypothetical protein
MAGDAERAAECGADMSADMFWVLVLQVLEAGNCLTPSHAVNRQGTTNNSAEYRGLILGLQVWQSDWGSRCGSQTGAPGAARSQTGARRRGAEGWGCSREPGCLLESRGTLDSSSRLPPLGRTYSHLGQAGVTCFCPFRLGTTAATPAAINKTACAA